jgi:hypothetical protein
MPSANIARIQTAFRGILPCPQSRPGNIVARHCNIRVKVNARINLMIEVNPKRPSCIFSARTRDINVKAERVVLRAIKYFGAVAGDNFMAEDRVP